MAKKFTALGAYIFAGGFTLGVRKHFDVLTHFEDGPYGVETAIQNKLIRQAHIDPSTWPVKEYKGEVDFVYGNPACAPWSMASAGRDIHWTEDPRINMVVRMFGLVDALEPKVWAWESVRPTFVKGRVLVNEVAAQGMKRGYSATVLMVDGQYHGVAQVRKRMFVVLHKYELPWTEGDRKEAMTVREALKGKFRTKSYASNYTTTEPKKLVMKMKQGERFQRAFDRANPGMKKAGEICRGRPGFLKFRLAWDEPSRVLLGGAHLFHPTEHRYVSVEEAAALCGYPRDFKFVGGGLSKQYAQVAQAVMPPVGEYLARIVRRGLENKVKPYTPRYERVEIFGDRIDYSPLEATLRMTDGLKLVEVAQVHKKPGKALKQFVERGQGIGAYIRELLTTGKETHAILESVRKKFPQSKATAADVSWNRRKLAGKE